MRLLTRFVMTATFFACLPLTAQTAGKIVAKVLPASVVATPQKSGLPAVTREAAVGMSFQWNDSLMTGPGGRIRARLTGRSFVSLTEKSQLMLQKHDSGTQQTTIDLLYGSARLQTVQTTKPDSWFEVRTNDCIVGAFGQSDFIVDGSNPAHITVTVFSGNIVAKRIKVTAGQQWRSDESGPTPLPPEQAERLKRQFDLP